MGRYQQLIKENGDIKNNICLHFKVFSLDKIFIKETLEFKVQI